LSLPVGAGVALERLVELLGDPGAPVSASSTDRAWNVHVRDALSGLEFEQLTAAGRVADLGSGAGLPGLVLAAALPGAQVELIESVSRKCDFIREAIERMGLANASVVCERAEAFAAGAGREACDAVTARAVGRLATIAELASPLLREGGVLYCWKGSRDSSEEAELERAAPRLAIEAIEVRAVAPYPASRDRHIHLLRKNGPTPEGLPRKAGLASKRPFGSE
jgi:16S rRNA (guanine527-N7)-methyltransferase